MAILEAHKSADVMADRIRAAVARLMTVRNDGGSFRVNVPVLFPSGSCCAIEVMPGQDEAFISDMGLGHFEAEFSGASEFYDAQARKASEQFGVGYDGFSIFALKVPIGRLEGGIAAIANASVRAASAAILRASEEKERRQNDVVYDRILQVFDPRLVAKEADIRGARDVWGAHNVVMFPNGQKAVFEFVSEHRNSISSKFFMFSDISGSDDPVSLNAVVRDREAMPASGAMLEDVGNVIEMTANDNVFKRYAQLVA
jgi:hypothetical protein